MILPLPIWPFPLGSLWLYPWLCPLLWLLPYVCWFSWEWPWEWPWWPCPPKNFAAIVSTSRMKRNPGKRKVVKLKSIDQPTHQNNKLRKWVFGVLRHCSKLCSLAQSLFYLDSIAVSLFTNSETAAATPLRVMRNFQRSLNQWRHSRTDCFLID